MTESYPLLTTLVGSRAYGLHRDTSDFDHRYVFAYPSSELLGLNGRFLKLSQTISVDKDDDIVGYEVGSFIAMALKGNPNIVEMLFAPSARLVGLPIYGTYGMELVRLAPLILTTNAVRTSFLGYARSSWRKPTLKSMVGSLRSLMLGYNIISLGAEEMLERGLFVDHDDALGSVVRQLNDRRISIEQASEDMKLFERLLLEAPSKLRDVPDLQGIDDWLMRLRREIW